MISPPSHGEPPREAPRKRCLPQGPFFLPEIRAATPSYTPTQQHTEPHRPKYKNTTPHTHSNTSCPTPQTPLPHTPNHTTHTQHNYTHHMELVTIAKQDPYRTPQSTLAAAVDQQAPAGTAGPNSPTIRRARFIRRQMQQQAQQQQQLLQQQQPQPTTGATQ